VIVGAVALGGGDLARTFRSVAGADWRWLLVALVLMIASLALRSAALGVIVNAAGEGRARFGEAFSATSIGQLANAVIPIRVGLLLAPYVLCVLLRRRSVQLPFPTALGVTLTERLFAVAAFLVLALACLPTLSAPMWAVTLLEVCAAAVALLIVGGVLLDRRSQRVAEVCRSGHRYGRFLRWLPQLVESQRIVGRPAAAAGVAGIQALAWTGQLASAYAALEAFHLGAAGLRAAALVVVLTNLIGLVPATPGNVGTFQVAAVAALAAYGVATGPALAYALGLQALQLAVGVVAGLLALSLQGMTLADLRGRSWKTMPLGSPDAASQFVD